MCVILTPVRQFIYSCTVSGWILYMCIHSVSMGHHEVKYMLLFEKEKSMAS